MILSHVVFTMEMPPMEVSPTNILAPLVLKRQPRLSVALEHSSSCPPNHYGIIQMRLRPYTEY